MTPRESCPLCGYKKTIAIYHSPHSPVFQNKVYPSREEARLAQVADVTLQQCEACGFVFNSTFDIHQMHYDANYQNEQAHSAFFQDYLTSIVDLFTEQQFQNKKIIEIGCGKGFFLELLLARGFDVTGFDPAYTGNNPNVIKDYFSEAYASIAADVIVLRHVLEHIEKPLDFLHAIGKAVNYNAKIYIEVPALEWIVENNAFWDIFYEHCNYFSLSSLGSLFTDAKQGLLFNGQYMYLIADLKTLRKKNAAISETKNSIDLATLNETLACYRKVVEQHPGTLIWGAGAKGVTFANLVDPDARLIAGVVDINPQKQAHFVAKTAHPILSPDQLADFAGGNMIVMNNNYLEEIKASVSSFNFQFRTLNDLSSMKH